MDFFSTAAKDEIKRYYADNQKLCLSIFGIHRTEELGKTDKGIWQLAVGTYLKSKPDGTYFLDYGTPKRLSMIVSVLEQDGMATGPWLVDCQATWEHYYIHK